MSAAKVLLYFIRHDLRVSDNPILHHIATHQDEFTHLLPVFVFHARQIEISGLIQDGSKSPFPEAKSRVGGFWRCGPHRTKFVAEAVWNMKESLEAIGSGLLIRAGQPSEVARGLIEGLAKASLKVGAVWMIGEEGTEEKSDEKAVAAVCVKLGADFTLWQDEKYFVDDRDVPLGAQTLPDVFTTYRKMMEPLRERPRNLLPRPAKSSLPAFPELRHIPLQSSPFTIPSSYEALEDALMAPVNTVLPNSPSFPEKAISAHPFKGGEDPALERLSHLIKAGVMFNYKDTRNGLIGADFSTKLSGYLAQGCITARQIHAALLGFENGTDAAFKKAAGFGGGQNAGTEAVRLELLWRDYMRLCSKKFGARLFDLKGFRQDNTYKWKTPNKETARANQQPTPAVVASMIDRFLRGTTGLGLIDASQRELLHTGYTSNRARQNVASFLAKHLGIDWRYGAEWYECLLVDYDISSNWANWQYVSGVGNDPRGENRIFNPVKQAFDYDRDIQTPSAAAAGEGNKGGGAYVRMWLPELAQVESLENLFQACTTPGEQQRRLGIDGLDMVANPLKRIEFSVDIKPRAIRKTRDGRRRGGPETGDDVVHPNAGPADLARRSSAAADGNGSVGAPAAMPADGAGISPTRAGSQARSSGAANARNTAAAESSATTGAASGSSAGLRSSRAGSRGGGGSGSGGSGRRGGGSGSKDGGSWRATSGSGSGGEGSGAQHQQQPLNPRSGNLQGVGMSRGRGGAAGNPAGSSRATAAGDGGAAAAAPAATGGGRDQAFMAPVLGGRYVPASGYVLPAHVGQPPATASGQQPRGSRQRGHRGGGGHRGYEHNQHHQNHQHHQQQGVAAATWMLQRQQAQAQAQPNPQPQGL